MNVRMSAKRIVFYVLGVLNVYDLIILVLFNWFSEVMCPYLVIALVELMG